jgi:hypothetical protein
LREPIATTDCRQEVAAAAGRVGVHAGLLEVRAGTVVRSLLEDELDDPRGACAPDLDLLVAAVDDGGASVVTAGPVLPVTLDERVARLSRASSISEGDARWALTTWSAVAAAARYQPVAGSPPDPRARLSFVDGPEAPGGATLAGGAMSRRTALLAAAAVVVLVLAFVAVGRIGEPDPGSTDGVDATRSTGPFRSAEELVAALAVPDSFTSLGPEERAELTDAEYTVDTDFDTACAALGDAMRRIEPSFPALAPKEYVGGGVNRCEAEAPVAALGGAGVRVLVLKATTVAQVYVGDVPTPTTPSTTPTTPS